MVALPLTFLWKMLSGSLLQAVLLSMDEQSPPLLCLLRLLPAYMWEWVPFVSEDDCPPCHSFGRLAAGSFFARL